MKSIQDEVREALRAANRTEAQIRADMQILAPVLSDLNRAVRHRIVRALRDISAELADEATDHQKVRARALTLASRALSNHADAIEARAVRAAGNEAWRIYHQRNGGRP